MFTFVLIKMTYLKNVTIMLSIFIEEYLTYNILHIFKVYKLIHFDMYIIVKLGPYSKSVTNYNF